MTHTYDAPPTCPACGGQMRMRSRRDGSGTFYGCTNYPQCKQTIATDTPGTAQPNALVALQRVVGQLTARVEALESALANTRRARDRGIATEAARRGRLRDAAASMQIDDEAETFYPGEVEW